MIDSLVIYPHKKNRVTFEKYLKNKEQQMKSRDDGPLTFNLKAEKEKAMKQVGLLPDSDPLSSDQTRKEFQAKINDLPTDRMPTRQYNLSNLKTHKYDIEEQHKQIENKHWEDLFKDSRRNGVSLEKFQKRYLYPFAEIMPLKKIKSKTSLSNDNLEEMEHAMQELKEMTQSNKFQAIMDTKYRMKLDEFGVSKGMSICHWLEELKKPLQITQKEIGENLQRFVINFPLDTIPHITEDERNIKIIEDEIQQLEFDWKKLGSCDKPEDERKIQKRVSIKTKLEFNKAKLKSYLDIAMKERETSNDALGKPVAKQDEQ